MIYITFGDVCVEILTLNKTEKELVDNLNVRPSNLKYGFVLFGVKSLPLRIHGWRDWTKQILAKHIDHLWVHCIRDNLPIICDIVEKFVEC